MAKARRDASLDFNLRLFNQAHIELTWLGGYTLWGKFSPSSILSGSTLRIDWFDSDHLISQGQSIQRRNARTLGVRFLRFLYLDQLDQDMAPLYVRCGRAGDLTSA